MNIEELAKSVVETRQKAFLLEMELSERLLDQKVRHKINGKLYTVKDTCCDDMSVELWIVSSNGKGDWIKIDGVEVI